MTGTPLRPRRGIRAARHQRRPPGHARDRRVRGALVRRPGRAAGPPRAGRLVGVAALGADPARAVHQPRHVQRAADPGPDVRRPVPAGRLAHRQPEPPAETADWPGQDKGLAALAGLALGLTIRCPRPRAQRHLPAVPFLGWCCWPRAAVRPSRSVSRSTVGVGLPRGRRLPEALPRPGPGGAVAAPAGLHREDAERCHGIHIQLTSASCCTHPSSTREVLPARQLADEAARRFAHPYLRRRAPLRWSGARARRVRSCSVRSGKVFTVCRPRRRTRRRQSKTEPSEGKSHGHGPWQYCSCWR